MLSLSTLIGLPLDIISKCVNIISKPTEPKVSSEDKGIFRAIFSRCIWFFFILFGTVFFKC